jgi:hypothetical protein
MNAMRCLSATAFAALLLAGAGPEAPGAQNLGPLLPESAMEIGGQIRRVHRDLGEDDDNREVDLYETSMIVRFGMTEFATLSGEIMIGNEEFHSLESDLRYYLIGAGLQGVLLKYRGAIVTCCISTSTTYLRDLTRTRADETHHGFMVASLLQKTFSWRGQEVTPWAGPVYFYYTIEQEPDRINRGRDWTTVDRIGVTAGLNVLLYRHAELYCSVIYKEHYQPRIGTLYRF